MFVTTPTLDCNGRPLALDRTRVMGIVNVTPDSFSDGGAHDTLEAAETVPAPGCVCGAIEKAEDVDYFKFHVAAPARLSFQVWGMRLQDKIHDLQQHVDPILTLRGPGGGTSGSLDCGRTPFGNHQGTR